MKEHKDWFNEEVSAAFNEVKNALIEDYQDKYIIHSLVKLINSCKFLITEIKAKPMDYDL
jgi:hypothetical protein